MGTHHPDTNAHDRIYRVLTKYLSEGAARTVMSRAEHAKGKAGSITRPQMPDFFEVVEAKAKELLADRSKHPRLHGELQFELNALTSQIGAPVLASETIMITKEWDIGPARNRAREMAGALGGTMFQSVQIMTLVSELARNIVLYTPGGRIELTPFRDPNRLLVIATDEGSGIPNLKEILAGTYRSRTGLGKGLLGTQRLSNRFDIQTGKSGTRIEAEVRL